MTVGQDLLKMETGGEAPDSKKAGGQTPKSPAAEDQVTSSYPEPPNGSDTGGRIEKSQPLSPPSPQTPKESSTNDINQHEQKTADAKDPAKPDSKISGGQLPLANREERRVFSDQSINLLKTS